MNQPILESYCNDNTSYGYVYAKTHQDRGSTTPLDFLGSGGPLALWTSKYPSLG